MQAGTTLSHAVVPMQLWHGKPNGTAFCYFCWWHFW